MNPAIVFDNIPSQAGNHNGGDIHFGKDGFLYIGVGDSGCDPRGDSGCQDANNAARDLSLPNGKILRVTSNGDAGAGQPVPRRRRRRVLQGRPRGARPDLPRDLRLRRAQPVPPRLRSERREPRASSSTTSAAARGRRSTKPRSAGDYGWNLREGPCSIGSTTNCGPPPAPIINPIHAYSHAATGCESITGGAFVPNGAWPGYDGTYMFADYICQKIFTLSNVCGSWSATTFASNLGGVTDLQFVGNELWYGSYNGAVHRIVPPPPPGGGYRQPVRADHAGAQARHPHRHRRAGGHRAGGGTRTVSLGPEVPAGAVAAAVNVTITGALGPGT